ncbi:MAG: hypothetical protein R3C15_17860 [Thermoleophilia bacterium]
MIRQRIRLDVRTLAVVAPALAVLTGLVLAWYGLMVLLLVFGTDPDVVNAISGYRTAYERALDIGTADVDGLTRLWIALGGIVAFLVLGALALRELPRVRLTRGPVALSEAPGERVSVEPRAVERAVEGALASSPDVVEATARVDRGRVVVTIGARRVDSLRDTLERAQRAALESLERHGLTDMPVDVTVSSVHQRKVR